MPEIITFILFLLLSSFAIIKIPFFKKSDLGAFTLVSLFCIKIIAGIAYALFYKLPKYYEGSDTWRFYRLSLKEKNWLLKDPVAFVKDLFVHGYTNQGGLFEGSNSYWNDLKSNVPVKILAVMNVITNSSYYTNIILFNFLFFIGLVALYRVFIKVYTESKWLIIIGIFLLPSTLFWCSGIHKDGLILSATGFVIFCFYSLLKKKENIVINTVLIIACLALIFSLRNYVVFAIIPALLCWWLSEKKNKLTFKIFSAIYLLGVAAFFLLPQLSPHLNFPQFIVTKQHEFLELSGGSEVKLSPLEPSAYSFFNYLPAALDMALLRPHFSEIKNLSYLPAIAETVVFLMLIILILFFPKRSNEQKPSTYFFLFFALSILLLTGYTITFTGAVVRYRSFALPFLVTPLLCYIDFNRFIPTRYKKKN